jgi:Na+-driven multidrug efflux pump
MDLCGLVCHVLSIFSFSNEVIPHIGGPILHLVFRGLGRQKLVLWLAILGFWVLGVPLGAILTFVVGLGVVGIWWGFAIGIYLASIIGIWRLRQVDWDHEARKTLKRFSTVVSTQRDSESGITPREKDGGEPEAKR